MEHFIKLARRVKAGTGASSRELQARRLAIAIIENTPGLDEHAIEGAVAFLQRAKFALSTARNLIDAQHGDQ
jgi:hypothetical protein